MNILTVESRVIKSEPLRLTWKERALGVYVSLGSRFKRWNQRAKKNVVYRIARNIVVALGLITAFGGVFSLGTAVFKAVVLGLVAIGAPSAFALGIGIFVLYALFFGGFFAIAAFGIWWFQEGQYIY